MLGSSKCTTLPVRIVKNEIEATDDRGRHWYRLRPKPRRRTDLWGFNSTWWMALLGHRDPPGDFSVPPVVT